MKKTVTSITLCFFLVISLFSQSDFKPGYIIKTNDDTMHGYIEDRISKIFNYHTNRSKTDEKNIKTILSLNAHTRINILLSTI